MRPPVINWLSVSPFVDDTCSNHRFAFRRTSTQATLPVLRISNTRAATPSHRNHPAPQDLPALAVDFIHRVSLLSGVTQRAAAVRITSR